VGDLIGAMAIVEKARLLNHHAYILVRSKHVTDIEELYKLGASQVIPEEFETAIDFFERILAKYLVPRTEIESAVALIRDHNYGVFRQDKPDSRFSILNDIPDIEISAFTVEEDSPICGQNLIEANLRNLYSVTVLAVKRGDEVIEHPSPSMSFAPGDIAYILGKPEALSIAGNLFATI